MAGQWQLGASIAVGSAALKSAPYNPARGRGVHAAMSPAVLYPLGSCSPQPISSASLRDAPVMGGKLGGERPLVSSFWNMCAFSREAWVANGRDRARDEKRRKGCGLARAAGTGGTGIRKSVSVGVKVSAPFALTSLAFCLPRFQWFGLWGL